MAKKQNQKIGCNVNSCKYNNCESEQCELNEIKVSSECDDAKEKKDTICDSYCSKENDGE